MQVKKMKIEDDLRYPTVAAINSYLERFHVDGLNLLLEGQAAPDFPLEKACDIIYSFELTGQIDRVTPAGARAFLAHANRWHWAADLNDVPENAPRASVHLTAYVLGALRLLKIAGHRFPDGIAQGSWRLSELFNDTLLPIWPKRYSHHSWRVSHWIGGTASILQSLWVLAPDRCATSGAPPTNALLERADGLVNPSTGLLKCYRSEVMQRLFKYLYRLRHDPAAGEVGGIVHLHWVNYSEGRLPYVGAEGLFSRAANLYAKQPFMEKTPFCLDFDIVQILRTYGPESLRENFIQDRAKRFIEDIDLFFMDQLDDSYALHKLPGALATQHEAAMILNLDEFGASSLQPIDIIMKAGWI